MFKYLLFLPILLFGSITQPFTMDLGNGYREDHLLLRLFLPGDASTRIYQEKYKHLRFLQTDLTLRTIQRDIFIWINGGAATIGKGSLSQGSFQLDFTDTSPSYLYDTDGYAFHAIGLLGYGVNLTPDRYYRVVLTPTVGYSGYWEWIKPNSPKPNPDQIPLTGDSFANVAASKPRKTFFRWNGFVLGANIHLAPGGPVFFDLFYAYHFLQFRERVSFKLDIDRFSDPDTLTTATSLTFSGRPKTNDANGHLGMIKASWPFSKHWEGSLLGKIFYFSTHIGDFDLQEEDLTTFPASSSTTTDKRKFKFTQLSLQGLLQISYKI